MMAMCLSNALYPPFGVEISAGLEELLVRDNNTVKNFRAAI